MLDSLTLMGAMSDEHMFNFLHKAVHCLHCENLFFFSARMILKLLLVFPKVNRLIV